jgi:hypothetical protein
MEDVATTRYYEGNGKKARAKIRNRIKGDVVLNGLWGSAFSKQVGEARSWQIRILLNAIHIDVCVVWTVVGWTGRQDHVPGEDVGQESLIFRHQGVFPPSTGPSDYGVMCDGGNRRPFGRIRSHATGDQVGEGRRERREIDHREVVLAESMPGC